MKVFDIKFVAVDFKKTIEDTNEFKLIIKNITNDIQSSTISFSPPFENITPNDYFEIEVEKIEPNEEVVINLDYQFLAGGRYTFYFWEKDAQLNTQDKVNYFIPGAGMYSGDTHNHSNYSDGKSTLKENRESMLEKGHSFLYSTDHNTLDHGTEITKLNQEAQTSEFLHLIGWEFTSKFSHALAYGYDEIYDPMSITEKSNIDEWQAFVDGTKDEASVFLAHPYEAPRFEFGDELLLSIKDITGIEVWNGLNHHALAFQNRFAFEMWDKLNAKGDKHYVGNAVSDAHSKEKQGNPFIKGYFDELNREGVHHLLESGKFFGSNGPEIIFNIGKSSIGETEKIDGNKTLSKFELTVFDPMCSIENVVIYKGEVNTADEQLKRVKKVEEIYPVDNDNLRVLNYSKYLNVTDGEFYRVEVITKYAAISHDVNNSKTEKGFAYTNPIWIEKK